jgi:hypothetical protein
MPSRKQLVVLFAILLLPSRLPGQATETTAPAKDLQPVPVVAVPTEGAAAPALDCCDSPPPEAAFCRPNPGAGRQPCFESVFIFGGQFTKGSMGDTADVFNVTYDNKYVVGLGYQRFPWSSQNFYFGWEVGTATRFGGDWSQEFWGGAVLRHHGFTIADKLTATMAMTAGFSMVTDTMGYEGHRVQTRPGDGTFLYYLGPEIILSSPFRTNCEVFYRLHHRCGGGRSLGNLSEGYNANTLGVRWKF